MSDVTRFLSHIEQSDPQAAERLLSLVYYELRKLAAVKLAQEKPGQTLQAAALVLVEPDFSVSQSLTGRSDLRRGFDNVHKAIEAMFRQRGIDYAFVARLPGILQEHKSKVSLLRTTQRWWPGGRHTQR